MDDVLVVGGSVAGCGVSIALAQLGLKVRVVEKSQFPREKVCGEGVMPHGAEALDDLGVAEALFARGAQRMHGIAYHHDGNAAVGQFKGRTGICVRRLALDEVLAERANAAGVTRVEDVEVQAITRDLHGWTVKTTRGEMKARFLVGADGARSRVRKWLGLDGGPPRLKRYGARQHFQLARPTNDGIVHIHLLGGAELYLTPSSDGCMNVAVLLDRHGMRRMKGDLARGYRSFIDEDPEVRALLDGAVPTSELAACGPLRVTPRDVVADGALLVGDAAGYVDAITGEGVTMALHTAKLAARVIGRALSTGKTHAAALRAYARGRAQAVLNHERMTEVLLFTSRHPLLLRAMVKGLSHRPDVFARLLAANDGSEDVVRALVGSAPAFLRAMANQR